MKRKNILCLMCAAVVFASAFGASACAERSEADLFELQEVVGFDEKNVTNISTWQQIPIVSEEQLQMGLTGGEGGQWPLCLTGGGADGSLMFYGTNVGGLYRSTDGGKSWHKSMKDLLTHGVCDVEIDPNNVNRVVCFGTNGGGTNYTTGVYLSSDMGQSWDFKQHFPVSGDRKTDESIAFDPTSYDAEISGSTDLYLSLVDEKDVIAQSQLTDETRGLYKSSDGGKTWLRINADLGDGIVKVTASGRVFVGNPKGLFASDDGGETFTEILGSNVTGLDVISDTVYALTDSKNGDESAVEVWKIKRDGAELVSSLTEENVELTNLEWQKFFVQAGNDKQFLYHFSPSVHQVYTLKVSPVDENNMIMTYINSLVNYSVSSMYSRDGGKSWHSSVRDNERADLGLEDCNFLPHNTRKRDFYWSPTDKNKVFDFENDFVSSSSDGGNTFFWNSDGINGICIGGVFGMNIFNPDLIYFGAQDYNGAFSSDGGRSWKYVNASGSQWGGHVYGGYAASESVIFGGYSGGWTEDRYLAVSYDGGKTVVCHKNEAEYKLSSGRGGRLNGQAGFVGYQAYTDRNVLFMGDLRSADMGVSWHRMSGVTGVYAHDSENGFLYGIDDNACAVVYSEDNGQNWNLLVRAEELNEWWKDMYISDLAVDSQNKYVYVTAGWSKLYKIDIRTRAIEDITENVPKGLQKEGMPDGEQIQSYFPHRLTTVAVDPNYPQIVYVGGASYGYQSDSGLFRSCDGGKTFYTLTSNSSTSVVKYGAQGGFEPTCIRVNALGDVWVAGGCLGFSKINAPYETETTRKKETHKVALKSDGGLKIAGLSVYDGRIPVIEDPVREGYIFEGWYLDGRNVRYDFAPVTEDLTLCAKWRKTS